MGYRDQLKGDPLPWLLEDSTPAVKHLALRSLLNREKSDSEVLATRAAAMESLPISAILAAQQADGNWVKRGPGYAPKYTGTVWQVIFLDQLGADGHDPRIQAACEYVLRHSQAESGGFGASGTHLEAPPPPSRVVHCLHGNLLRALIGFGWLGDERVRRAIDWLAQAVLGQDVQYYKSGTTGPGFGCAANGALPCAWGAVKELRALALVPSQEKTSLVTEALKAGANFLLDHDLAHAAYPAFGGKISSDWFKFGFPLGYTSDILEALEVLVSLGYGADARIVPAVDFVLNKQDNMGRWKLEHSLNGKMWVDIEQKGRPSKWVTLRVLRVLKGVFGK